MGKPLQTTTHLSAPAKQIFALFRAKGRQLDLPMTEESDERLTLKTPRGDVQLLEQGNGVRINLSAADRATLHTLQETIDRNLDGFGLKDERSWSLADAGALPANMVFATVASCIKISPSYYRVRLTDPSLGRFGSGGLHFRLLFAPAEHDGQWPAIGEDGRTHWPGGMGAWHRPVYTVRSIDPESGTLEFDVFAHEGGRVTAWCEAVRPGDRIALMGPGGEWYPEAGWIALFGDETALPAIARILAACPQETAGIVTVLVGHEDDIQDLSRPGNVRLRWLLRGGDGSLLDALSEIELPDGERFVWFASERSEVAAAREILSAKGLDKSEMRAASYWTAATLPD